MEQFNKALSFILGLVVVAVFIVVASGKFNIKGLNLAKSTATAKITPTSVPSPTKVPAKYSASTTQNTQQNNTNFHSYSGSTMSTKPSSIPNTGVPIVMFPLLGSSLIGGIFMKKFGKKD